VSFVNVGDPKQALACPGVVVFPDLPDAHVEHVPGHQGLH
jgi:hypothetical protein